MRELNKNRIHGLAKMMLTLTLALIVAAGMGGVLFSDVAFAVNPGTTSMETTGTEVTGTETTGAAVSAETAETGAVDSADKEAAEAVDASDSAEAKAVETPDTAEVKTETKAGPSSDALGAAADSGVLAAGPDQMENCDFQVTGAAGSYSFDKNTGVLTVTGDVTISMKDGKDSTSQRIVVADNAKVTIDGLKITAEGGPAVKVNSGVKATLTVTGTNDVTGASGYAGVESGWEQGNPADLTIEGKGTLNATGGDKSAGIGASYTNKDSGGKSISSYCGNITVNSGAIKASGTNGGAGIGSANNNNRNADGTSNTSASYKMLTTKYEDGGVRPDIGTITINGGDITATGSNGAGIGGGNHSESGKITINNGSINASGASGIGCGTGSHEYEKNDKGGKGPGYYYTEIEINGGSITAKAIGEDNWGGAGIGGGGYCDTDIKITGGDITAYGGSCGANHNSVHHGGAGIGGGYESHADIEISGGNIKAYVGDNSAAAAIGSGGTPNSNKDRGKDGKNGRSTESGIVHNTSTSVTITGGTVVADATKGRGGSGIGGGTSADKVSVTIAGGTVTALGARSSEADKLGGAGIGSGLYGKDAQAEGMSKPDSSSYHVETAVSVSITGGDVTAVGGWGAAGIGSGARNKIADTINIDASKADIEAYADGTKFAIDTRDLKPDGSTESYTDGRTVQGNILQGTFVHEYVSEDGVDQGTEGIKEIQIINDADDSDKVVLTGMDTFGLDGYRSFASNVSSPGDYNVYTQVDEIAHGEGRYFSKCKDDVRTKEDVDTNQDVVERGVKYRVTGNSLSDNFYLFPVKAVIVTKTINYDGDKTGLTGDVYFSLRRYTTDGQGRKTYADDFEKRENKQWIESIHIENGNPKTRAEFICVDEAFYDVWEVTKDGTPVDVTKMDVRLGDAKLVKIETRHDERTADCIQIDKELWTDSLEVINYYEAPPDEDVPSEDPDTDHDPDRDPSSGKPKTGDESHLTLYIALLTAAAIAGAAVLVIRRRSGDDE